MMASGLPLTLLFSYRTEKYEVKEMKTIGKWIGALMIFSILIALFSIISPIILVIGGLGIWYYTKKEPNPQKMIYSVVATVIGLFGSIFLLTSGGSDSESSADNNANTSTTTQTEQASCCTRGRFF
jgi:hypothetical protein